MASTRFLTCLKDFKVGLVHKEENMSSSCFGDIYVQTSNQPPPAFSSAAVSPGTSSTAIFDAWEKLMDDETSESYWKD
ncbi:hypothetical protein DVH24_015567 [Malus domestica]|uniref:Uncharacterized protein n=1 Tax=Malus domestica TaxID=3750 RepID=A0A498HN10_MALDO|nr:hypothetical protein DVH24_015567 [Malus domestica]